MSITVQRPIPKIAHAGNPMLLYLNTNNQLDALGNYAHFHINLAAPGGALAVDATVKFTVLNQVLEFTAKASPDESGLQVRTKVPGNTDQQYLEKLGADIHTNYVLNYYYNYSVNFLFGAWRVTFSAKDMGVIYNVSGFVCSSAALTSTTDAGADRTNKTGFKVGCITWLGDVGSGVMLGESEDRKVPDENGDVVFDISAWFAGYLKSTFQWPMTDHLAIQFFGSAQYYNTFFEVYGDSPTPKKIKYTASKTALNGKLDQEFFEQRYRSYGNYATSLENYFITEGKVLHNRPFQIKCRPSDNEKLYFLAHVPFTLKCTVFFTDNTSQTINLSSFPFTLDWSLVFEVNCSPWFLGVENLQPFKTVTHYRIFANPTAAPSTNVFDPIDIYIDRNYYPRTREFLFKNRAGSYEFTRFTGYFSKVEKYEWVDYTPSNSKRNPYKFSKNAKFSMGDFVEMNGNTGPLSKEKLHWLREFFESEDIYEIINMKPYSLNLLTKEFDSFADSIFEKGVDFSYTRADEPFAPRSKKCGGDAEVIYDDETGYESHLLIE